MKDFPLPVRSVGSGSQPVEDEELQYLEMPRGMNTFRMPIVPERVDAGALGEACDLLAAFLAKLTALFGTPRQQVPARASTWPGFRRQRSRS